MKRLFAGMTAALLAVILVFSVSAESISARSYVLLDAATGRVLQKHASDQRSLIASTTKIMTALIVCEQCNVLDRMRIPKEAVGIEGSSLYLREGEVLTIQELLYGLMLHSGNDAATALAIYCSGTVEAFSQQMNDKAHTLGLTNTHFENPHGLDSGTHYSTAEDLAKLAAYAMENPIFSKIVSTKNVKIGSRQLTNHNKLLWQIDGADGVKTGYTKAAGRILVSSVCRGGRRLIAVTICAPNDWNDHSLLHESGFLQYKQKQIISTGDVLGTIDVAGGDAQKVHLVANEDFSYPLSQKDIISVKLPNPAFAYAPVAYGQSAGCAGIFVGECKIGTVEMIYGETIEQEIDEQKSLMNRFLGGN